MAIIRTVYCDNGAVVHIDDADFAGITPEENARRLRRLDQAIMRVNYNAYLRERNLRREDGGAVPARQAR